VEQHILQNMFLFAEFGFDIFSREIFSYPQNISCSTRKFYLSYHLIKVSAILYTNNIAYLILSTRK